MQLNKKTISAMWIGFTLLIPILFFFFFNTFTYFICQKEVKFQAYNYKFWQRAMYRKLDNKESRGTQDLHEDVEMLNQQGDEWLKAIHQKDRAGIRLTYSTIFLLSYLSIFSYFFYLFGGLAHLKDMIPFLKRVILPTIVLIIIGTIVLCEASKKPQRAFSNLQEQCFYKDVYGIELRK